MKKRYYSAIPSLVLVLSIISLIAFVALSQIMIKKYYEKLGNDIIEDYMYWQESMYIAFPLFGYLIRYNIADFLISYYSSNYNDLYKRLDGSDGRPPLIKQSFDYCGLSNGYVMKSNSISINSRFFKILYPSETNYKLCFIPLLSNRFGSHRNDFKFENKLFNHELPTYISSTLKQSLTNQIEKAINAYNLTDIVEDLDVSVYYIDYDTTTRPVTEISFKYVFDSGKFHRETNVLNRINTLEVFDYVYDHFNRGILLYNFYITFYFNNVLSSIQNPEDIERIGFYRSCYSDDIKITLDSFIRTFNYFTYMYPSLTKYDYLGRMVIPSLKSEISIPILNVHGIAYFIGLECNNGQWVLPKITKPDGTTVSKFYECEIDSNIQDVSNLDETEYRYYYFVKKQTSTSQDTIEFYDRYNTPLFELKLISDTLDLKVCSVGYVVETEDNLLFEDINACYNYANSISDGYYKVFEDCDCVSTAPDQYTCNIIWKIRSRIILDVPDATITYPVIEPVRDLYYGLFNYEKSLYENIHT